MRFSLKTFLIVVAIVAVIGGVILNRAKQQATAISRIAKAGGYVAFDDGPMQMGSGSHDSINQHNLVTNIVHSVTIVMVEFGEYERLRSDLRLLDRLERIVFIGNTSECDISEVQDSFPNAEIVDLPKQLLECIH